MTELQLQRFTHHFNFGNNRQSSSIAHGYIIGTVTFDGVKGPSYTAHGPNPNSSPTAQRSKLLSSTKIGSSPRTPDLRLQVRTTPDPPTKQERDLTMGCDIHLYVERRDNENSPWKAIGKWEPLGDEASAGEMQYFDRNKYENWHSEGRSPHPDVVYASMQPEAPRLVESPIQYTGRSYWLFAALADVRNEGNVTPIAPKKGMPEDATHEVTCEHAAWGPDAHSASHYTVTELALWQGWKQRFETSLWVTEGEERRRLDDQTLERLTAAANHLGQLPRLGPDSWNLSTCSWSSNPEGWRTLNYSQRLDLGVGAEWWMYMNDLHRLALQTGPNNTRIVFWFDN